MLPLCVFILVTYAVLPIKWTNRTWFGICAALSCCCIQVAFIIPLGTKPEECHNEITPNDMYSDVGCAFSGSLVAFGGCCLVVWAFIRTVAFHLQVCWEIRVGAILNCVAIICGLALIAADTAVMLRLTGVSYRFGQTCHINARGSSHDYWIPLIVVSTISLAIQLITVAYCIYVYIKSLYENSSSVLPSQTATTRTVSARHAYRRIREVLQLQWRGIGLSFVMVAHVILLSVVFMTYNAAFANGLTPSKEAEHWILCLATTKGDKEQCLPQAKNLGPGEGAFMAALCLLSLVSFWCAVFLMRLSMFHGWVDFFKHRFNSRHEFVSGDAISTQSPYEMIEKSVLRSEVRSPSPARMGEAVNRGIGDRYPERRTGYSRPFMSFSTPHSPSSPYDRDWDPQATFAPSYRLG
ncbi:hypothetical protein MAP00_004426 [Monascus purpureus]|nr:hypothetical protein MAP00_004426 [Monascus purpureus]